MPVVAYGKQIAARTVDQGAAQAGAGARGILEFVGHHQFVGRFIVALFQQPGGHVQHVFEVDAALVRQRVVPRLEHRSGDFQEAPVAFLELVLGHLPQTLGHVFQAQAVALGMGNEGAHQSDQVRIGHGLCAAIGQLAVRVGVELDA
ncbi:hypothetical protein D3C81_1000770 [compost metagenome]